MVGVTGTRRRSKAAQARDEAILSAALDLFLEKGIGETRIEEILLASGTSVGSFYYRYESKIELAAILYLDIIERFYAASFQELRRLKTAEEQIRGLVQFYLRRMAQNQKEAAYEFFGRTPEVIFASQPREKIARAKFSEALTEMLDGHVQSGVLRKYPADLVMALWMGPAEILVQSTLTRMGYFTKKSEREFSQTLLGAQEVLSEAAWQTLKAP